MNVNSKVIKKYTNLVQLALSEEKCISEIAKRKGEPRSCVSDKVRRLRMKESITKLEQELIDIYDDYLEKSVNFCKENSVKTQKRGRSKIKIAKKPINNNINYKEKEYASEEPTEEEIKEIEYDAYQDDSYDERSTGEILRESEENVMIEGFSSKKISSYSYNILIKGRTTLSGFLTREEMELLCRLYSNIENGAGLNIRTVSRYFSHLTYIDIKRILRAFNITKQSFPLPRHIIEEKSQNEILDLLSKIKEDNIIKKNEQDKGKNAEKELEFLRKELYDIKQNNHLIKEIIKESLECKVEQLRIEKKEISNKTALCIHLSDMHVGAHTPYDSIYKNNYNKEEVEKRLGIVLTKISEQHKLFGRFERVIINNLGDSIDGFDRQTVRRHHELSQNMDNKQQYNVFIECMLAFFDTLHKMDVANNIDYHAVTNDNHSGSAGYIANKTLKYVFNERYPDMNVDIFEKFIQHYTCFNHTFILTHGKDERHQKYGHPLVIDKKTELYFDEYIRINKITNQNISICKGDLHQSATTYGKGFRYKSIPSFYGSSDYIHINYGNTPAAFEYEIIREDSDDILSAKVELN
jgi:hypothetical protein